MDKVIANPNAAPERRQSVPMKPTQIAVLALAGLAVAWPAGVGRSQANLLGTEWRVAGIRGKAAAEAGIVRFEAGKVTGRAA